MAHMFTHTAVIVHIRKEHECDYYKCPADCTAEYDYSHHPGSLSNGIDNVDGIGTFCILTIGTRSQIVIECTKAESESKDIVYTIGARYFIWYTGPYRSTQEAEQWFD